MSGILTLWHRRADWPRDPADHVFILRAIEQFGARRFPQEWTGAEPTSSLPHRVPFPRPTSPRPVDVDRAERLLARHGVKPEVSILGGASQLPHLANHISRARLLSDDNWETAARLSEAEFSAALPAVSRFAKVTAEIAALAESGALCFMSRPKAGGFLVPVDRSRWNTEALSVRFTFGQFKPSDPFSRALHTEGTHWLFVTAGSLSSCLGQHAPAARSPSEASLDVSPYLQLMLEVSEALQITPENQPKKVVVEAALIQAWKGPTPLSGRLLDAMATLLREPESQKGRRPAV